MNKHQHEFSNINKVCEACLESKHWYCICRKHCQCIVCKRHDKRIGTLDDDYSEDVEFVLDDDFSENSR